MKGFLLIAAFLLSIAFASAQTHPLVPAEGKIPYIFGDTTGCDFIRIHAYTILIYNRPVDNEFSNLPRFAIIGKDKKFYFSTTAVLRATASYDWGNPLSSPSDFVVSRISPHAPGNNAQFLTTMRKSSLSFNFVGLPGKMQEYGVYFSVRFNGSSSEYGLKLHHAYVRFHRFTFGYTSSLYKDSSAVPFTIDSEGPCSLGGNSNTALTYQKEFKKHYKIGIGMELSETSYTPYAAPAPTSPLQSINQRLPDIPLYLQYKKGENHLRLSSMLRCLYYRNPVTQKNHSNFGYGAKLSGVLKTYPLLAYFEAQVGSGIASCIQDDSGKGLDMVPNPHENGKLNNSTSWGGFLGIQLNYTPNLFSTVVYSYLRNYIDKYDYGQIPYDDQNKYSQYVAGNLIWKASPFISTGIEYLYGRRNLFSGDNYSDNRIMAMFLVSF